MSAPKKGGRYSVRLESSDGDQATYRVEIFRSTGEHHEWELSLEGTAISLVPRSRTPEDSDAPDSKTIAYLRTLARHVIQQRGPDGRWPQMFQRWRP